MGEEDELGVVVDVESTPTEFSVTAVSGDRVAGASRAIGPLKQGWRKLGINMGGFWMLDVVRAVLEQIGPASLSVTSYACGAVDAQTLVWLRETGRVTDLRLVVDRAMTAVEYWAGRLNATTVATGLAIELGHTSTATAWEKLAHAARVKLEEAQKRARADERRNAVRRARR